MPINAAINTTLARAAMMIGRRSLPDDDRRVPTDPMDAPSKPGPLDHIGAA